MFLLSGLAVMVTLEGDLRASPLSIGLKVKTEHYGSSIPLSRNFRICFQTNENGTPMFGLCSSGLEADRIPATQNPQWARPQPKPSELPK